MHPDQMERFAKLAEAVAEWRKANGAVAGTVIVSNRPIGSTKRLGRAYDSVCKRVTGRRVLWCHRGEDHEFAFYQSEKEWCEAVLSGDAHAHMRMLSQLPAYMAVCAFSDRCDVECYCEDRRGVVDQAALSF